MEYLIRRRKKNKLKEAKNKSVPSSAKSSKAYNNIFVKAISLLKSSSDTRENLSAPEYNLEEIRNASEADSYIKMALMKYSYMLFKAGYILKSENEKASDYIKTRFSIMSFATKKPIDILFQEIGDDLIKYSNAFLIKSRVPSIMPGIQAKGFFKPNPIGGYFRVDPATMSVVRNKNGDIKKYVQIVEGEEKSYDADEVVHFYLDKEAANAFGTPRIIAALEDVKVLRRIEGNVMSMIYRFAMPLFQWIVGKPIAGFQATDAEIEKTRREIENMPIDGSVVTNEKTDIKVIGAEGNALNAKDYLNYFEARVFSGLGVSASQMGRGGSKQDADSMESQAHDTVKYIQKTFSLFMENFIINELLFEGGFNPLLNEDDRVKFVFNEININTKIKVENHEMAKFQSNMLTFEEMRKEIGKKESIDESRLYNNMITVNAEKELTNIKTKASADLIKKQADENIRVNKENSNNTTENNDENSSNNNSKESGFGNKSVSPNGNGKNKNSTPNKDISNKNTPENQYGKTSVKVKESLDKTSFDVTEKLNSKKKHKKKYQYIYKKYQQISNDIKEDPDNLKVLMSVGHDNLVNAIKLEIQQSSSEGINKAIKDLKKLDIFLDTTKNINISLAPFEEMIEQSISKTLSDIEKKYKNNKDIEKSFDTLEYRIRFLIEYVVDKTYWYSYLKTGDSFNYKKAIVDFHGSKDEESHPKEILLNQINIDDIPPYHPFCDCSIKFKKGEKKV